MRLCRPAGPRTWVHPENVSWARGTGLRRAPTNLRSIPQDSNPSERLGSRLSEGNSTFLRLLVGVWFTSKSTILVTVAVFSPHFRCTFKIGCICHDSVAALPEFLYLETDQRYHQELVQCSLGSQLWLQLFLIRLDHNLLTGSRWWPIILHLNWW